ncbi:hypothetical protein [Acinetobacter sp.]|uniref:hypothetical protein n=1 Tax=Acinetobacter sp. TaxID=472 RepID=UPI00388E09E4
MKTANFPRDIITGRAGFSFPFEVTESDWLISICSRRDENAPVEKPFARILFMKFDDVAGHVEGRITPAEAREVAQFIIEAREAQKNVWVNCQAGICRSGAIASLLVDLGWEYADSTLSPGQIPNHFVYDSIRKHFPELKQSWDNADIILPDSGSDPRIWLPAKDWK